uniref:p8 n=1 Tax=Grapevine leafroll-associated virus 7 TaxID=217615 RepID=G8H417_9CLOS|nr:P8 [Grapevine leafroll-associated virus 7]
MTTLVFTSIYSFQNVISTLKVLLTQPSVLYTWSYLTLGILRKFLIRQVKLLFKCVFFTKFVFIYLFVYVLF